MAKNWLHILRWTIYYSILYKSFYRKLVAAVVEKHGWNLAMAKQDGCELATASNEAFTLLVVKNYCDRLLD